MGANFTERQHTARFVVTVKNALCAVLSECHRVWGFAAQTFKHVYSLVVQRSGAAPFEAAPCSA